MKFKTANPITCARRAGFTLVEVLAALLFMAIVIPVALQGLRVASRAGSLGERKAVATRIAESKLNEVVALGLSLTAQKGMVEENGLVFTWQSSSETWREDAAMRLVSVDVTTKVQGQDYDVKVSTLVDATLR